MGTFSVSCGGTGGHVFPGVATAMVLRQRGHEVTLWLAGKAIETASRQAWDGPVIGISAETLSLHPLRLPRSLVALVRTYRHSLAALKALRPQALLAMGSYSSLGPVLAARWLKIPVVLHEANVIPGRAISLLSPFAHTIAITFPETRRYLSHPRVQVTGLPLRPHLENAAGKQNRPPPQRFTVLTMGGSQGAQRLNELVPVALGRLRAEGLAIEAIHLSGEKARASVESAYQAAGVPATVHGFCTDMVSVYNQTTLALSRSGANSCLELALFGIPAILVPYPHSARDHQTANAQAMATAGAAHLIGQNALTADQLADMIRSCYLQPNRLDAMTQAARQRSLTGAAHQLADLIEHVAITR